MGSYQQAVDYLYRLQWYGRKLGLEKIRWILKRLNDPQRRYQTVHIAGTNGKGSTAALIATLLQTEGYHVGLFTSPHLVDFSERIRVNGRPIPHDAVADLTHRISQLASASGGHNAQLTFFEFTTAMAFLYFAESCVDLAIIEVGMGGRLDATNVITPLVSIITNVDYDHQAYLGDTLDRIAFEKAGIIKPRIPTVTAVENTVALDVIREVCQERQSRLYQRGQEFQVEGSSSELFGYRGMNHRWSALSMNLLGQHQLKNVACALAAIEVLSDHGVTISEASVREGLHGIQWEGRLEPIEASGGPLFLLDGAHNPAGARALREFLLELKAKRGGRLLLVLGIMRDKDIPAVLEQLVPLAHTVVLTRPDYHRAASLTDLEAVARSLGAPVMLQERVSEAVELARNMASSRDCICITGSLFTVGEARALLKNLGALSPLKG